MPHQFGNQAARLVIRQHLLPFALLAFHRVAQQHTREAKAPGMLPGSRQVHFADVIVIHTPAYAGFANPLTQMKQARLINVEPRRQHRHIKQRQHVFAGIAAIRE